MVPPTGFESFIQPLLGNDWAVFWETLSMQPVKRGVRLHRITETTTPLALQPYLRNPVPWAENSFYIDEQSPLGKTVYHEAGAFYIQEPSAMAVATAVDAKPGERILDLCAAPGGKTTAIGGRMQGQGVLVANEIHPTRVVALAQNLERLGIPATVTNDTPDALAAVFPQYFDAILVDAPCSGEGMFRKAPAATSAWMPESPYLCAARQRSILASAVQMLRPGARLIYSTCTFNAVENEQIVAWLLNTYEELEVVPLPLWPGWTEGIAEAANGLVELRQTRRLWPQSGFGEGHFVACLKRTAGKEITSAERIGVASAKQKKSSSGDYRLWIRWLDSFLNDSVAVPSGWMNPIIRKNVVFSQDTPDFPGHGLKILRHGTPLATVAGERITPHHALAMRVTAKMARAQVNLDEADAIRYLRGESLTSKVESGVRWVHFNTLPLGFGNGVTGRLNNWYPKGIRRMDIVPLK